MARRRRSRRRIEKAIPAMLSQSAGGRVRSAEEVMAGVRGQTETGLAKPLPRDTYPYEFGPNIPLIPAPLDPPRSRSGRAEPRLWEYPVGWNLPGTGLGRLVPWKTLRDAANLPLIRDCIRIRKSEVQGLEWDFTLSRRAVERAMRERPDASRLDVERELRDRLAADIDRAVDFWAVPDRGNGYTFAEWITQALEEHLVLDALAIYPRYTLGGDLYALEVLDGSTIKPLLDHRGGRPMPPQPAYQQILHGFPRGEFTADTSDTGEDGDVVIPAAYTADQLIYIRREVRAFTPYGFSPVEQALADIDLWMKRLNWIRAEYTEGVMPAGWLINEQTGANAWTPAQIAEYERELNDYLSGNTAARHRYRVLPPGLRPDDSAGSDRQAEKYKPEFDLHLLKLIVAHFDLTIHELGFTEAKGLGSDGHAEGQDRLNERKGRLPVLRWFADLITEMSRAHLGLPRELEFRWLGVDDDEQANETEQVVAQVSAGLLTINEARDQLGRSRFSFPEADKAAVINGSSITFVEGAEERQQQQAELEAEVAKAKAQAPPPGQQAKGDDSGPAKPKADAKKAAEARAYRKWAAKSASRAFELEHIEPDELDVYGIDPGRVTWSGKAAAPQGADLDRIADECSAALRRAALTAIDVDELAAAWAEHMQLNKGLRDLVRVALAWLRQRGYELATALGLPVQEAVQRGWQAGVEHARDQLATGSRPPAEQRLEPVVGAARAAVASVAEHRFNKLAEVLASGVEDGLAPAQLARNLRGVLDDRKWADTVAVTETARAMSAASQATYQANGVGRKRWLLAPDQRVCPTCSANAAQGAIDTTSSFVSGDVHPPAHPRCRCALMPVIDI